MARTKAFPSDGGTAVLDEAERAGVPVFPENGTVAPERLKRMGIALPELRIEKLHLRIIGDSPLVTHAWSEKAKKQMADKQQKKATGPKAAKNPHEEYVGSLYWISKKPAKATDADIKKATFGIPAIALKRAAVDACSFINDVSKVEARGAFHVVGDLIPIVSGPPVMREDMVRLAMGVADMREPAAAERQLESRRDMYGRCKAIPGPQWTGTADRDGIGTIG